MSKRLYRVTLTPTDRASLRRQLSAGSASTRLLTRAHILLKADESPEGAGWTDQQIVAAFNVCVQTDIRIRQRYAEAGLQAALQRRPPRREYRRKLDGAQEAHLVALACSPPPLCRRQWSLRLLASKAVELRFVDGLSHETVPQLLKKRPQAVADQALGAARRAERRVRGPDGGRAGRVRPTAGSAPTGRLPG